MRVPKSRKGPEPTDSTNSRRQNRRVWLEAVLSRGEPYAGASVAELKRLKELEAENAKLKRMHADLALENAAIKDVLSRKR